MSLWGSSLDASRAVPYKLPHDEQLHLPPSPTAKPSTSESAEPTDDNDDNDGWEEVTETSFIEEHTSTTKTFAKPTAHLPEELATAPGHSTLALDPTIPTSTSSSAVASPSTSAAAEEEGSYSYLGAMASLIKNSNWLFASAGIIGVFVLGLGAFFFIRRRRLSRANYEFERVAGDEGGVQMSSLESGQLLRAQGSGRTRDLYDAFGVGSDSEEEEDDGAPEDRYRDQRDRRYSTETFQDDDEDRKSRQSEEGRPLTPGKSQLLFEHKEDDAL
jgi:kexin